MADHAARPKPGPDGIAPTRGDQECRTCGEPIHRVGKHVASDGVAGQWRHRTATGPANVKLARDLGRTLGVIR